MRIHITLDHQGIGQILRSAGVRTAVEAATARVEAITTAQSKGRPVISQVTPALGGLDERPIGMVTIAHPAGLAQQAKRGTLTRAASAVGLSVTQR